MLSPCWRIKVLVLTLTCALVAPACWARPAQAGATQATFEAPAPWDLFGPLCWVSAVIAKAGCTADPNGCSQSQATPASVPNGAGCTADPDGAQGQQLWSQCSSLQNAS